MKPLAKPAVVTPPDCGDVLPDAEFYDAYALSVAGPVDAHAAAERVFAKSPAWVDALMTLRNFIVGPLGLVTKLRDPASAVGMFPVLAKSPERLVLGLDDRHLDFRILVDVAGAGASGQVVTVTTRVKTHNALGRIYLAVVMPFHRLIVPAMLSRLAA